MRRIFSVAVLLMSATQAAAQTAEQKAALDILAGATAVGEYCPLVKQNSTTWGIIMAMNGISAQDIGVNGRFSAYLFERMAPGLIELEEVDTLAVCRVGIGYFGPEGTVFANLMQWKDIGDLEQEQRSLKR